MRHLKLRITLFVFSVALAVGTMGCQNGFMVLDFNGEGSADGPGGAGSADGTNADGVGVDADGNPISAPPEGCTPDDRFFLREVWAPAVATGCYGCHNAQGAAKDSNLVLYNAGWGNYLEANREVMSELAQTKRDGESVLLLKPLASVSHGGGAVIQEGDDTYNRLKAFVDRVENPSSCEAPNDEDFYRDVMYLDKEQTVRKATLSLAGRLPTDDEFGAPDIDSALDTVMSDEAFYTRLTEYFNDIFLTDMYLGGERATSLLDEDVYPNRMYYGDDNDERDRANTAVAREPLALINYVVRNDRPFTEILTADYTVVNPFSARVYGVDAELQFNDPTDPNEWQQAQIPGVPHAGVVTTVPFLNRYPTTDTNLNRHRSAIFYNYFMATDVLKLADRPLDQATRDLPPNPTRDDASCNVCHNVVDPVAGAFQNWDDAGRYNPPEAWHPEMLPPGLEGEWISGEDNLEALSWLAERVTADQRFVQSAVHHGFKMMTGEEPLTLPKDATRADYEAAFRAYEVQYEFFKQVGQKFVDADYNFKTIIKEVVKSPYYRAHNARSVSPKRQLELANFATARLLTPEQLDRKITAVLGTDWEVGGRRVLLDTREFALLYGGIDSRSIVKRATEPSALIASIARRMANEMSCLATARDFARPTGERLLFPNVDMADTPDTNDAAIRENIKHLHWQLLGEKLEDTDPSVERAYTLFNDVLQDGQQGDYGTNLPGMCQADGITADDSYTVRAWMSVVTYLLNSYEFLYE